MDINSKFKTCAVSFALCVAMQASATQFSYTESFDDPAVDSEAALPEGWATDITSGVAIKRYGGSYIGTGVHSGTGVLGTNPSSTGSRDDWAFSKAVSLKKGTEYTVSYWLKAAGGSTPVDIFMSTVTLKVGTAQNKAAMTTELGKTTKRYAGWEQVTYTFTPDADGDYYFGFNIAAQMYNAGAVAIDDFEVSGEESETGGGSAGGDQPGGGSTTDDNTLLNVDFDNDADFAAGTLPEGWLATGSYPMQRNTGSFFGTGAHSGNYVLGANPSSDFQRNEKVYTKLMPMKAGQEYTLSFWFKAPGGVADIYATQIETKVGKAQTEEAMTTTLGITPSRKRYADWTQLEYKFTPETSGNYCFSFGLVTEIWQAGAVAIDDIVVTGATGGSENPGDDDDRVTVELPYSQSFDNENKDYDGKTFVPKGWLATGTSTFVTASEDNMPARDGVYYLLAPESNISRDDRIYTPFFNLEAGKTYNAEFYLYMPGSADGYASDFSFTVGTEQDSEFHTTTLLSLPEYTNTAWKKFTVPFTPTESDKYCFSFLLGGENVNAGEVCIDLFTLKAPGMIAKPVAGFTPDAAYSAMSSSKIFAVAGAPVKMVNYSTDAETYEWTAGEGVSPSTSTEKEPSFSFAGNGSYDITLKVTNAKGTSSVKKTVNVETISKDTEGQFAAAPYADGDGQISRDYLMKYDTDPDYDYVTGFNHYYHKLAQKFALPQSDDMTYTVSTFSFGCNFFQLTNVPSADERQKPFSVVFYGDKNGAPDTDNVLARQDMTIAEAFPNTTGNSSFELRNITLKEPVTFKAGGTFYVSLEFSPEMTMETTGSGLYRSFFAMGAYRSQSKATSFFVQPEAVPEGSLTQPDGKFYPVDVYDADYKGLGLQLIAWVQAGAGQGTGVALTPDGKIAFAARIDGNTLTVSGTKAGDTVTVYDTTGNIVARAKGSDSATTLAVNAPAGLYIVSTPAGVQKFIKK